MGCIHYYKGVEKHGCHLLGICQPEVEGTQPRACPKYESDKPKVTINEMAEKKSRCRQAKAAGKPCTEFDKTIVIPEPPTLLLNPIRKRAIVTVSVGNEAKRCLAVSEPYMRLYAARLDADFVKLEWPGHQSWPMSAKFAIPRVLDYYERIVYVDADVLLRPSCMNLFEACSPDEFGAVDQLPHHTSNMSRHIVDYRQMRTLLGFKPSAIPWYFNAGIMVLSKKHAKYLLPTKKPIKPTHCAEQDHTNAMILEAVQTGEIKIRLLDRRCNWQSWQDVGFKNAPPEAILHWSGSGAANRAKRASSMATCAERYPLPVKIDTPEFTALYPVRHPHYADIRHVRMIHDELMSGKYRRVLEIGCYDGYSTCGFLEALKAGKIEELHLCDVHFRDQLKRVVTHYGLKVHFHEQPSLELLENDTNFDLVFVDGDHSESVAQREAAILLKAGVKTVFAHDTAEMARTRYGVALGPKRLADSFRADNRYFCSEDSVLRAGERTERGLFMAKLKSPSVKTIPKLSIIIPTTGRKTIGTTIASLTSQLEHDDEIIIQRDSTGDTGATPRTKGMFSANGDYILFMDDDDIYTPTALSTIRKALVLNPNRIHIFPMASGPGWKLPQYGLDVRVTNVSTQMIVLPNDPSKFGQWGLRRRGDYDFIASTVLLWDSPPIWQSEVTTIWRPK